MCTISTRCRVRPRACVSVRVGRLTFVVALLLADKMLQHRKTAPLRTPPAVEPWRPRSVRQSQPPQCSRRPCSPARGCCPARSALTFDAISGLLSPRRPVAEGTTSTPNCDGSSRESIRTRACTRAMAAQFLAILMRCVCVCPCLCLCLCVSVWSFTPYNTHTHTHTHTHGVETV